MEKPKNVLQRVRKSDAGERTLVIEADRRELSRLRADLRRWLADAALTDEARRDIVLVASELIAKVLDAGQGHHPVEVCCRHTHSIAVIEVAQPDRDRQSGTTIDDALEADALASEILRGLTSRVTITRNANRSGIRCTLSLCPAAVGRGRSSGE